MTKATATLLALALLIPTPALALITGGAGNEALELPGLPDGAAEIFNHPGRVAWWEGPPFGGGQWHAECCGDAEALGAVLADFAALDVKKKRIILHDGVGQSFWLNPNRGPERAEQAKIDWEFTVWNPESWEQLHKLPKRLHPTDAGETDPPAQIDVYTARIPWSDVEVPAGLEVVDGRLEAHGFTAADGLVIEGRVKDLATGKPLVAAMRLERVEQGNRRGRKSPIVAEVKTDAEGRWVLKKAPAGWVRVVVEAEGYAPRIAGYERFDQQPQWAKFDTALARPAAVAGRVIDASGKPLPDVEIRFDDAGPEAGDRYDSPAELKCQTDAEGRFRFEGLPAGKATLHARKNGYCSPGLPPSIDTPKDDVELRLLKASSITVTVDFGKNKPPKDYMAMLSPEGGDVIGSYGGAGSINKKNQFKFDAVPPGKYILTGRPNPGREDETTEPFTVNVEADQAVEVTLVAD